MIERIMEQLAEPESKQKEKSLNSDVLSDVISVRHIHQVKPLKDQRHSKSKTLNVKGGEGCLPIR
ncbi:MAG: hypothetical protein J0M15_10700 [Deltaproteobacteria bacterium]|jgi:hypothetical protein|nr:hypothetical protein [Deltaproteobacteria bacterium]